MINKNVVALGFVSFFTDMSSSMVTSILPLFIIYILQEGIDKLGYVVAIATLVSYGFRIIFGYLSDKYRIVKPFIVTGYFISAITKPMLYFTSSWGSIAALRGLERVGKAVRSATKDSLISKYSNGESGKTFGFHKMMDISGELVGSILVFILLYYFGQSQKVFQNIFAFTLIPGLISVFIILFFVEDAPYKTKTKEVSFDISKDYALLPVLFIFFGFTFFMFNDSFFLIKAKEVGYSLEYIPLLVILLNLTQSLLSYYSGIKIDKFGTQKVLLISFVFGIVSMLSLYLNFIIAAFIFLGIFIVTSFNAIRAFISQKAYNKGTVYGLFYGGVALSAALGASIMGIIWKMYGEQNTILISLTGLTFMLFIYCISSLYNKKI